MTYEKRRRVFNEMSVGESIGSTLDSFHRLTEIACFEHAKELGIGDDVVRPKGWMWLIAKTSVEFFHPWTQDGDIVVQTLPVFGSATGLLWMIEIQTASGPLARQTYHWVLADQASGRPLRMPETLRGDRAVFKQIEDAEYGVFDKPAKLVQSIKKRWIPASDVDENGHVHNTCHVRYAFEDATRWPMRYAVWYHAPLMAESELSIRAKQGTGLLVLEGFFVLTAATPTFTVRVRIIQ